jgi:hypothetical protein
MSWLIKYHGMEFNSDDFLIEDLGEIEKATGEPWSISNPYRTVAVARAFLAMAMIRTGRPTAEVEATMNLITLRSLKTAFEHVEDSEEEQEERDPSAPTPNSTSPDSSIGEATSTGPLASQESSDSAIAS